MSKGKINWGLWSAIATGGWILYEYMKGQNANAASAEQLQINASLPTQNSSVPTTASISIPSITPTEYKTPGIAQANSQQTNSSVAMPNIKGMTVDAIRALATQMNVLGMATQADWLLQQADSMEKQGIANAPAASI